MVQGVALLQKCSVVYIAELKYKLSVQIILLLWSVINYQAPDKQFAGAFNNVSQLGCVVIYVRNRSAV